MNFFLINFSIKRGRVKENMNVLGINFIWEFRGYWIRVVKERILELGGFFNGNS